MEEFKKIFFTTQEIIEINKLINRLKYCIEKDYWFEISENSAKTLNKYITQLERSLECMSE